jgi:hypothetical protein
MREGRRLGGIDAGRIVCVRLARWRGEQLDRMMYCQLGICAKLAPYAGGGPVMLQTVSRFLPELPLFIMTAVATHLVMSFAQTLMHCKLGHRPMAPLIKPSVPISGIRFSDWLHREAHGESPNRARFQHGE